MVMMIMTMTLTNTMFISPDYGLYGCVVYISRNPQKSKSLTIRFSRGLLQPKPTANPVSTASPASHSEDLAVDCEGLGGGSE